MCNSKPCCSCVELLDHFCQCFTQLQVHNTVHYCKFCILTTHIFITFIASFVTSLLATLDINTSTTFPWSPSFRFTQSHETFPTDPRYGVKISPTPNHLKALGDRQMLKTQLLDCLLQRSTPPPNEETRFEVYLGTLAHNQTWRVATLC